MYVQAWCICINMVHSNRSNSFLGTSRFAENEKNWYQIFAGFFWIICKFPVIALTPLMMNFGNQCGKFSGLRYWAKSIQRKTKINMEIEPSTLSIMTISLNWGRNSGMLKCSNKQIIRREETAPKNLSIMIVVATAVVEQW